MENYCLDDLLKLDNQICFPLYVVSKEIIKKYKPFLDEFDITYTQYLVLLCLWENDNVLVKELGSRLYLDSGTLTPLLQKLEKKGYIKKNKGEGDGREVYISLTDSGRNLKEKAYSVPSEVGCQIKLNPDDAKALYNLLHQILEGLKNE